MGDWSEAEETFADIREAKDGKYAREDSSVRRQGRRSKDKAQAIVDAIYRCVQEDKDGDWWMDNAKAVAIVRKEMTRPTPEKEDAAIDALIVGGEGEGK